MFLQWYMGTNYWVQAFSTLLVIVCIIGILVSLFLSFQGLAFGDILDLIQLRKSLFKLNLQFTDLSLNVISSKLFSLKTVTIDPFNSQTPTLHLFCSKYL